MDERWRNIPDHPGYQASDHGRIRSIDRLILCSDGRTQHHKSKILKGTPNHRGYLRVRVGKHRYIQDLVLEAFVGPRPPGMHGCHADDNKTNNHLSNLSWDTPTANEQAKVRAGRHNNAHTNGQGSTPTGQSRREYFRQYRQLNGDRIRERDRERDRASRQRG